MYENGYNVLNFYNKVVIIKVILFFVIIVNVSC